MNASDRIDNSGVIVKHKDGRVGKMLNKHANINGKAGVSWATDFKECGGVKTPISFTEQLNLVDGNNLFVIGFID